MSDPQMSKDGRKPVAQGDVIFVPVDEFPSGIKPVAAEDGNFIVAHSETGHHHVIAERPEVKMFSGMTIFRDFLDVEAEEPVNVEHLRETHTHETLSLAKGKWMIVRQRAHTVEGWQRAVD